MIRDGYVAGWRGTEYEASPDGDRVRLYASAPADGFAEVAPGRYVRVVSARETDHLSYVRTVGTWRNFPVVVLAAHGGWLRVEYDSDHVAGPPFERFDRGLYQAWAPRDEVTDLREEYG